MEPESPSSEKKRRGLRRVLLVIVAMPLACVLLCAMSYMLSEIVPHYVVVDVTIPEGDFVDMWHSESTIRFFDGGGRLFVRKAETSREWCESESDTPYCSIFRDWPSIVDYFDTELAKFGWVRVEYDPYRHPEYLCHPFVPSPLNLGDYGVDYDGGFVAYVLPDYDNPGDDSPVVCLAGWRQVTSLDPAEPDPLHVELITINPSLMQKTIYAVGQWIFPD